MKDLVFTWLDSHAESLELFEGEDEITLRRQGDFILLGAQLTASRSDNTTLQNWLRLGAASLAFFQGVLSQKADSGALWLIQTLRSGQGKQHVLDCLESLLNQRDTWRATFARAARPAQNLKSTSLRSLSY
ncbi:type III secretion protein [Pseudomonas fluorescens]|uniref:Type III secretion protein n=1 Tax=Pseudomonas fluorescens TaxID=294 RepID=A0A7Z6QPM6_PSEFL|nr:type III secretion protein [Pseudomonas fluorescens]RDS91054.1 type III secretion protein [Pseudomonas fluorescens]